MRNKRGLNQANRTLKEWAEHLLTLWTLGDGPYPHHMGMGSVPHVEDPAVLMQAAMNETFRPSSPIEVYSDEQPVFVPPSPEEEGQIPIDILLGCYLAGTQTIKIFHKNIAHFASTAFKCDAADLEIIVRLHEYAHALHHLGLWWALESKILHEYPAGQQTDWRAFRSARSSAFRSLPSNTREFLAQLLCWIAVGVLEPLAKRYRLQELFIEVLKRQPPDYHLSADILGKALYSDPTFLLEWARRIPRRKPTRRTSTRLAAEALLRVTFP